MSLQFLWLTCFGCGFGEFCCCFLWWFCGFGVVFVILVIWLARCLGWVWCNIAFLGLIDWWLCYFGFGCGLGDGVVIILFGCGLVIA